jgi:hypothetical protein
MFCWRCFVVMELLPLYPRLFQDMGVPIRRDRTYGIALNRESMTWLGPAFDREVQLEFFEIYERTVMLDGDAFANIDDVDATSEARARLARNRGFFGPSGNVPFESLFTKSQQGCIKHCREKLGPHKTGVNGALIMDVSQSESRTRLSAWIPAVTRSSTMVSLSQEHIFTPHELDFAMGWPVLPVHTAADYKHTVPPAMFSLSSGSQKRLAGNGMCLQQVLAWYLYVHAHCLRKSVLADMEPPLARVPKRTHSASDATSSKSCS